LAEKEKNTMSIEENKAVVVRHLKEFLEQGNIELIDGYFAPDGSDPAMWSVEQWKEAARWQHKHSPGFKVNLLQLVAEGDWVMAYIQFDVTYSVPEDPSDTSYPFGKLFSWRNVNVHRVVNGKIVTERFFGNMTDMLVESGMLKVEKVA
jgi:predicted ester cyclase